MMAFTMKMMKTMMMELVSFLELKAPRTKASFQEWMPSCSGYPTDLVLSSLMLELFFVCSATNGSRNILVDERPVFQVN